MTAATAICPTCDHANPPGSRFCNACGAPIAPPRPPEPAAAEVTAPGSPPPPAVGPTIPQPPAPPAPTPPGEIDELPPGAPIDAAGRYVVSRLLGRGGFGQAYLVYDTRLSRHCVAKRQLPNPAWSARAREQARQNFRREAQLLVSLNAPGHPNIPEIYEFLPEQSCLVMKYVEGDDLGRLLGAGGRLPRDQALAIVRDVCAALVYMHSRTPEPVLHRDIKPSNILLDRSGRVWVIDFGLSKATPTQPLPGDGQQTQMAGTLGFTPPEQWRAAAEPRSDVYALAATLHVLLTGYRPDLSRADLPDFLRGVHRLFPPARQLDPEIPGEIEELISAALSFEPARRPGAAEFLAVVERALAPMARPDLQAPDGTTLADELAIAHWAEQHWEQAAAWLYASLPDQLEQLWGRNKLAGDLRAIVGRNPGDQHAGLDALIALLDPAGFGAAPPRPAADRRAVDFGPLGPSERREETIQIANRGRRYLRLEVKAPHWVVPGALRLALPPGRQQRLTLSAHARRMAGGSQQGAVLLRDRSGAGFRVEVRARSSRWRALWLRATGGDAALDWAGGDVRPLRLIRANRGGVWGLAFSADGRQIASGGWDQAVRLWQVADGKALGVVDDRAGNVLSLAYSPDGALLAAAGGELVKIYDARSGRLRNAIKGARMEQDLAIFSPDGQQLITRCNDDTVRLWRCADGTQAERIDVQGGAFGLACSPDGALLAVGREDHSVGLRSLVDDSPPRALAAHQDNIAALAFSPDGLLLASCAVDGLVCVWELETDALRHRLRGHQSGVRCLAFHPDGLLLASGGIDGSIRLWRCDDGALLQVLNGHSSGVMSLAFSRDGALLASGGGDGTVTIWQPG